MATNFTPIPPVINGLRGSYQQPGSWGRNSTGFFWNYVFEGTAAEVENDVAQFNNNGAEFEVTELLGGRKRLTARVSSLFSGGGGFDEQPENVWELSPNEVEKELLEADFPNGTIDAISAANKAILVDALQRPKDYLTSSPAFSGSDSADANSLYLLMKNGVRAFPVEASTITHTQIVSNRYTVQASFTNVGRIISSASMYSLENVPYTLLFSVPTYTNPSQFIEAANDLAYGWRKIRPRVTRQNYTRWQVVNAWQFGLWSLKLWGTVL